MRSAPLSPYEPRCHRHGVCGVTRDKIRSELAVAAGVGTRRSVLPAGSRTIRLATKDSELLAEHQELDVLGPTMTDRKEEPPEELTAMRRRDARACRSLTRPLVRILAQRAVRRIYLVSGRRRSDALHDSLTDPLIPDPGARPFGGSAWSAGGAPSRHPSRTSEPRSFIAIRGFSLGGDSVDEQHPAPKGGMADGRTLSNRASRTIGGAAPCWGYDNYDSPSRKPFTFGHLRLSAWHNVPAPVAGDGLGSQLPIRLTLRFIKYFHLGDHIGRHAQMMPPAGGSQEGAYSEANSGPGLLRRTTRARSGGARFANWGEPSLRQVGWSHRSWDRRQTCHVLRRS